MNGTGPRRAILDVDRAGVDHGVCGGGPLARQSGMPVANRHHWSVYLVFASLSLLCVGLVSSPNFLPAVRRLLALR